MINVTFFKKGENFTGFELSGHSGYSQEGTDIICSAVSSVAYMTANTVTEVLGVNAAISLDDGYMKFIPEKTSDSVQVLLKGMSLHLNALAEQYGKYLCCTEKTV